MIKFLMKKSTLAVIALVLLALVGLPVDVLAQNAEDVTDNQSLGPFEAFLVRGATLFAYTRNALYVAAAFVFMNLAWTMITKGKFEEWEKLLWMMVGFIILGVSGFIVGRLATGDGAPNAELQKALPPDTNAWGTTRTTTN
jgi:cell division protein FtsW (lipid II flippase)